MYDECSFMDVKRKGSGSFHASASTFLPDVILGPGILRFWWWFLLVSYFNTFEGQMNLTGYRLSSLRFGEIKIEFKISNCMLELKVKMSLLNIIII